MFDDPKKELERLQQQLLAAEEPIEEDPEDLFEDIDEAAFCDDELYDDELQTLLTGGTLRRRADPNRDVSGRATGYDADDYEMDPGRYVAPPKKKGIGCLASFALTLALFVIALVGWALWRML